MIINFFAWGLLGSAALHALLATVLVQKGDPEGAHRAAAIGGLWALISIGLRLQ